MGTQTLARVRAGYLANFNQLLLFTLLFISGLTRTGHSATIAPYSDLGEMALASDVVVSATVRRNLSVDRDGITNYRIELEVVETVKGQVPATFYIQRYFMKVNGYERIIFGDVDLEEDRTYLLFLADQGGNFWQPLLLSFGIFVEDPLDGDPVFRPAWDPKKFILSDQAADAVQQYQSVYKGDALIAHLQAICQGQAYWDQSAVLATELQDATIGFRNSAPVHCSFLADTLYPRWDQFPGTPLPVTYPSLNAANCSAANTKLQTAISTLNTEYGGINVTFNVPHTFSPDCATDGSAVGNSFIDFMFDSLGGIRNVLVQYDDPCSEISDLNNCAGTLAFGGVYILSSTHTSGGETWRDAALGFVITNNGVGTCLCTGGTNFDRLIEHELTHTLGLGHISSGYGNANMNPYCCISIQTLDQECVDYVYPSNLPVELIDFSSNEIPGGHELKWTTASELNNRGFEVHHSTDGNHWNKIGFVPGKGTTLQIVRYQFTFDRPLPGPNYYRLKQLDFDGAFEYSQVIQQSLADAGSVRLIPNPTSGSVRLTGIKKDLDTILLYDALGRPMARFPGSMVNFDLTAFPAGLYYLHLVSPGNSQTLKVLRR